VREEEVESNVQAFLIIPTLAKSFIWRQHLAALIPILITSGFCLVSTLESVDPVIAHAATFDQIAASLACVSIRSESERRGSWTEEEARGPRRGEERDLQSNDFCFLGVGIRH
jgi:hypothetical protein